MWVYEAPLKEKLVTNQSKFDALLAKLLNAKPLPYKEPVKRTKTEGNVGARQK